MTGTNLAVLVLVAAAILFMVYRQFSSRPVEQSRRSLVIALAVVAWGVFSLTHIPLGGLAGDGMIAAGVAFGLVLGGVRGSAMRTWRAEDGVMWQRGTVVLALLWVLSIGVRLGLEVAAARVGVPQSTSLSEIPLFFGVTLAAQNAYVLARVKGGWPAIGPRLSA